MHILIVLLNANFQHWHKQPYKLSLGIARFNYVRLLLKVNTKNEVQQKSSYDIFTCPIITIETISTEINHLIIQNNSKKKSLPKKLIIIVSKKMIVTVNI